MKLSFTLNEGLQTLHQKTVDLHLPLRLTTYVIYIKLICLHIQGVAFNVTHFESRITHLLYTAINTPEHGQVSQRLGFTKSLTSSTHRLGDVLHDNQGNAAISQVHLP